MTKQPQLDSSIDALARVVNEEFPDKDQRERVLERIQQIEQDWAGL